MPLPKIEYPTYTIKVPSTGKEIRVRPFIVKEEKMLLMAVESKDDKEIVSTTKQVINNCIVEGDIDVDTLPFFDIDYIFIALRAKSIGEKIDMQFVCNNTVNGDKCNQIFDAPIDIANAEIEYTEKVDNQIYLSNGMMMKMRYPTYAIMKVLASKEDNLEKKIRVIGTCIESITQNDNVYTTKDYTKEELYGYIGSLTEEDFKKLEKFVDNFPRFVIKSSQTCPKCKYEHKIEYRDFTSFFR